MMYESTVTLKRILIWDRDSIILIFFIHRHRTFLNMNGTIARFHVSRFGSAQSSSVSVIEQYKTGPIPNNGSSVLTQPPAVLVELLRPERGSSHGERTSRPWPNSRCRMGWGRRGRSDESYRDHIRAREECMHGLARLVALHAT